MLIQVVTFDLHNILYVMGRRFRQLWHSTSRHERRALNVVKLQSEKLRTVVNRRYADYAF